MVRYRIYLCLRTKFQFYDTEDVEDEEEKFDHEFHQNYDHTKSSLLQSYIPPITFPILRILSHKFYQKKMVFCCVRSISSYYTKS